MARERYRFAADRARRAIKDIVEMPDVLADRVIRSIEAHGGQLSGVLAKEIPYLLTEGVLEEARKMQLSAITAALQNQDKRLAQVFN